VPVELGKGQNYSQGEHRISGAQKVPTACADIPEFCALNIGILKII